MPDRTRALLDDLARVLGIDGLPGTAEGGLRLMADGATEIVIHGGDDETVLLVSPVGPLPHALGHRAMLRLLQANLFSSSCAPFQVAADETGMLVFWGRLWIADLDGASLAGLMDAVAGKVAEIRADLLDASPAPPLRPAPAPAPAPARRRLAEAKPA